MACPYGYGATEPTTTSVIDERKVRLETAAHEEDHVNGQVWEKGHFQSNKSIFIFQDGVNKVELKMGETYGDYLQVKENKKKKRDIEKNF